MDILQELHINIQDYSIDEFAELVTKHCGEKWNRALEQEKNIRSIAIRGETALCFERCGVDEIKNADLIIHERKPEPLYVSNIVPSESTRLSCYEYNQILNNFVELVLEPAIEQTNISYELSADKKFIKDVVGEAAEKDLEAFSASANKSTGSSHPLDQQRWFQFLVTVNRSNGQLSTELLGGTLIEEGWSEDVANGLAIEFEFSQALLDFFKGK